MPVPCVLLVCAMLLLPPVQEKPNPWLDRVGPAVAAARRTPSAAAFRKAFDAAFRADDWRSGLTLAQAALDGGEFPQAAGAATSGPGSDAGDGRAGDAAHAADAQALADALRPEIVRALWRAGWLLEAERELDRIPPAEQGRVTLTDRVLINLARGRSEAALTAADQLLRRHDATAAELSCVLAARVALNRTEGLADLIERARSLANPANGYPDTYIADELEGLAEFFRRAGERPLNDVTGFGEAVMNPVPLISLPGCSILINGRGPYRAIVDTGGSITLSLDEEVAAELGLESIASSSVRGVAGKQSSGQAIVDELQIGEIRLERVMTRTFNVRKATAHAADAVLGTGVFAEGRMKLDFLGARLVLNPSSDAPATGEPVPLRLIADAKLIVPTTLAGEPAAVLLDTGADVVAVSPSRLGRMFPDAPVRKLEAGVAMGVGADEGPELSLGPGMALTIGSRQFENTGGLGLDVLDTLLSPILGVQCDVLAGMAVLREARSVTVDFPQSKMWIDWLPPAPK